MVSRGDILMLGISAGVSGSLVGGLLLFAGLSLVINGYHVGWLLLLPAAPAGAVIGWIMGRRLAAQLPRS